jgi:hypothetical protein
VTRLRKMMLDELQRRNFSEDTIRHYIRTVEDFARHFNCPPDRLGLRHIREYQAELFQKRKLWRVQLRTAWRPCGFSTSRRSKRVGASPRHPTRKRITASRRFSVRKKSHDSSMLRALPSIAQC